MGEALRRLASGVVCGWIGWVGGLEFEARSWEEVDVVDVGCGSDSGWVGRAIAVWNGRTERSLLCYDISLVFSKSLCSLFTREEQHHVEQEAD